MIKFILLIYFLTIKAIFGSNDTANTDNAEDIAATETIEDNANKVFSKPLFLAYYPRLSLGSIVFALQLSIFLIIMLIPLPILHSVKKAATNGIGIFLGTAHIVTIIIRHQTISWFFAYLAGALGIFLSFNLRLSTVLLSVVGAYTFAYFIILMFNLTYFTFFVFVLLLLLVIFVVLGIFMKNIHYIIIKSAVGTLLLALIINLMTPFQPLAIMHNDKSGWFPFLVKKRQIISKIIISGFYLVIFVINLIYDGSVSEKEKEDDE